MTLKCIPLTDNKPLYLLSLNKIVMKHQNEKMKLVWRQH